MRPALPALVLVTAFGLPACDAAHSSDTDAAQIADSATSCMHAGDCASGMLCVRGACGAPTPCTTSRQCPGLVCDPAIGACVECVTGADCPTGMLCRLDVCEPALASCTSDGDCSATMLVCDRAHGVCVQCNADADCAPTQRCGTDHTCIERADAAMGLDGGIESDAGVREAGATGPVDSGPPTDALGWQWEMLSTGGGVHFPGYSDYTPASAGDTFYALSGDMTPTFARYTLGAGWTPLASIALTPADADNLAGPAWVGDALYLVDADSVYRYDITTGVWTTPLTGAAVTVANAQNTHDDSGHVYVVTSDDRIATYDIASNTLSYQAFGMGTASSLPRIVWDSTTQLLYVAPNLNTALMYSFDPATGAIVPLSSPPWTTFLNPEFCGDRRGHLYAAADGNGYSVRRYDIASDSWSYLPPLPFDHSGGGACIVTPDGYLYLTDTGANLARLAL